MRTLLILTAGALTLQAQTSPSRITPTIDLVYRAPNGTVFEANCNALLKTTIDPEAVKAAVQRTPELQQVVNREIGPLLSTTYAEVGMSHPYQEVQATLTVCPGINSMSGPLFLNVRPFLPTAAKREPDWYFVEVLYHELMHTYVGNASQASAFRKKYAGEERVVLSHLHVMALEKFVLLKLGRAEELAHVAERYKASPSAAYKRAWEIVDQVEDYQSFIKELKQYAARLK